MGSCIKMSSSQNHQRSKSKMKKFKPHKIPRYLPGSVQNDILINDLIEYNKHLYKLFTITKKVDDNPPKLDISMQVNRTTLAQDSLRLIEIARENRQLLIRINKINKTKGMLDTYNPNAHHSSSQWKKHQNELQVIETHNKELCNRLKKAKSNYNTEEMNRDWQHTVEKLKLTSKYSLVILHKKPSIDVLLKSAPSISSNMDQLAPRLYCFMEFSVPKFNIYLGKIIIELYHDFTPVTVQNFFSICKGEGGITYEKCQIHNIVRGQCIETGDIVLGNGKGGTSIYGDAFDEENYILKHTKMGVLSTIPKSEHQNDSKFSITLGKMEKFNGKRVVFGKVVKGNSTLIAIESLGRKIGKPPMAIIISRCGEYKILRSTSNHTSSTKV